MIALEVISMTKGKKQADLDKDRQLNLALVRLLEIIGEAASRVPKEEQARYADISWSEIISLRNRLIHGYDTVNFDYSLANREQHLPGSMESLRNVLDKEMFNRILFPYT